MEWKKHRLRDLALSIQTGPFGSQLHQSDYSESGVPVIMPKDIINGKIVTNEIARVSDIHVQRLKRHKVRSGDIIYSRRGDVGRCSLITEREEGWLCGTGCLKVALDKTKCVPSFIAFILQRKDSIGWVENHAVGATMPNLNTGILSNLPLIIPTFEEQRRIASILSAYDNLIENNNKRIRLLEQMAKNLYKEWFVRFRFPGHEKAEFENGLPKGWKIEHIGDVCETLGGGTPSTSKPEYWNGEVKWVTPTDITTKNSLPLLNIEGRITEEGLKNSSAKLLPPYTILMTSRASIGYFGLAPFPVCTNQGFISIIPNMENMRMYILHNLMTRKDEIIMNANGATFLEISKGRFRKMKIVVPDDNTLDVFEKMAKDIFMQVLKIEKQNALLMRQRDLLLPRLMSGKLEVNIN